jgi:outer membrane protein
MTHTTPLPRRAMWAAPAALALLAAVAAGAPGECRAAQAPAAAPAPTPQPATASPPPAAAAAPSPATAPAPPPAAAPVPPAAGAPPDLLAPPAAGPPVALTLQEAEAEALRSHPQVLAAEDASAEARQLLRESRAAYYPTINGEVTGSLGNKDARIGAGALTASRLFNREGQGLVLSQLITDSGRTPNLVGSARSHAGAADQNFQATRAGVLLAVDRAYFDALQAQAVVTVAQQAVAARQAVADQTGELARNNLRSQLDVSFAAVNLADARLLLIRAQARALGARDELAREMGSAEVANYVLSDPPLPASPGAGAEAMVATALAQRPDLASVRLERDAAAHFEQAEKDLKRPVVSLAGVAGSVPLIGPDAATVPDHYEGAALNIEVPIWNGHLYEARQSAAHYRTLAADQRVRDLEEIIARDVRSAWAAAMTAYQSLAVAAEYQRQATLAMSLAQGRYDLGLASIVELTQAQLNLTQAEIENATTRYDFAAQSAALQYTIGALR